MTQRQLVNKISAELGGSVFVSRDIWRGFFVVQASDGSSAWLVERDDTGEGIASDISDRFRCGD